MARRRWWRWVGPAAGTAAVAVALAVPPTRTWLEQEDALADGQRRLAALEAEGDRLEERAAALDTPEEVERLAREQYGLVKPGERAFAVLPPAPAADPPPAWWLERLVESVREALAP